MTDKLDFKGALEVIEQKLKLIKKTISFEESRYDFPTNFIQLKTLNRQRRALENSIIALCIADRLQSGEISEEIIDEGVKSLPYELRYEAEENYRKYNTTSGLVRNINSVKNVFIAMSAQLIKKETERKQDG